MRLIDGKKTTMLLVWFFFFSFGFFFQFLSFSLSLDNSTMPFQDLQEYHFDAPDDLLPYYFPNSAAELTHEGVESLVSQLRPFFDRCYEWEVQPSLFCFSPFHQRHRVYGRPCVNHTFSRTGCMMGPCKDGYVEVVKESRKGESKRVCVKRTRNIPRNPDAQRTHEKVLQRSTVVTVALVIGALLVINIFFLIIVLLKLSSGARQTRHKAKRKQM